jgi:hypothetical protein
MANIIRCILDSANKTNLSRFLSGVDWPGEKVNDRRTEYLPLSGDYHEASMGVKVEVGK